MTRRHQLQLRLWREACRHTDIADSFIPMRDAIRDHTHFQTMHLFQIDHGRLTLIAPTTGSKGPFTLEGNHAAPIIRLARKGGLSTHAPTRKTAARAILPAIHHPDQEAHPNPPHVLIGGLLRDGRPEGLVAWTLTPGREPTRATCELFNDTLEPLAAALDTSRRFHELESHRKAAEADRQSALQRLGRASLHENPVGASTGLRTVMARVETVAAQDVPVLIFGETGSGKEVIARAIHERSRRHDAPFLRVNCGAIPPELIDSHLFGHEKGAFTGAAERRLGWFERSHTGTLFLDEIGDLPLPAQVRLLRVLQEGTLERVGAQEETRVNCRIIAATHRDLSEMVRARTFREDLWYRLAVFPILIPPLRERPEDLPAMVRHFAARAATRFGMPEFEIHDEDIERLKSYPWPGNVRELAAVIDRAALLGTHHRLNLDAALGPPHPTPEPSRPAPPQPRAEPIPPLNHTIRNAIQAALHTCQGRIEGPTGAAALLQINPSTLRSKMRKLNIPTPRQRDYNAGE